MKKIIALLLSCAMCFALLTACGSNGSTSSNKGGSAAGASASGSSESKPAEGGSSDGGLTGTLKLGAIGPITGAAATYGKSVMGGANIAVDEINKAANGFSIQSTLRCALGAIIT